MDGIYGCSSTQITGTIGFDPWPYFQSDQTSTRSMHSAQAPKLVNAAFGSALFEQGKSQNRHFDFSRGKMITEFRGA